MPNPNTASFPFAASTDTTLTVANDLAQTTLSGDINNSTTTIGVASTTSFVNLPVLIVIDGEIILAQTQSGGNTFTNCIRGFAGTTAVLHTNTTAVFGYLVSYHHNQVAAEVNSISNLLFNSDFSGLKRNENLLTYSEAFETGADWFLASGTTIPGTTGMSPIGDSTARNILEGNTTGVQSASSNFSHLVIGATYTFSVYAQYTNNRWITIGQNVANDTTRRASFDIQNGVVGIIGSASNAALVPLANNWYRCLVVTNCTASVSNTFDIAIARANNVISYTGAGTANINIWGGQVRSGGFDGPLTYCKTTGTIFSEIGGGDLILDEGDLT